MDAISEILWYVRKMCANLNFSFLLCAAFSYLFLRGTHIHMGIKARNAISLHESAASARRMPDTSNFVSLVRHKSRIRECTRDDMLRGQRWHYIPSLLPAFTVCQDCFDEVVQPQLRADSDIAMRFNGEPQFVSSEGRLGSSCQLYSARMRRVFKRAVEDNDLKYLARRAKERKEVEDKLQGRVADINYMRRRLRRSDSYALSSREEAELDRLQDECEGIAEEWSAWE
ncbi:hypothetical protein H2203_006788 [Taxawa tesnikishii (nom. ined.)]|nr:hypothetical protein H2203_006788 [Dothideales sp. JES 119]